MVPKDPPEASISLKIFQNIFMDEEEISFYFNSHCKSKKNSDSSKYRQSIRSDQCYYKVFQH